VLERGLVLGQQLWVLAQQQALERGLALALQQVQL
jgi:hypothetical protein